ncbi:hypothetical protein U1Q18_020145 [Sarracenia purpurea var. burkii]
MLTIFDRKFKRLCFKFRWPIRRRPRPKIVIKKIGKSNSEPHSDHKQSSIANGSATVYPKARFHSGDSGNPIRVATFNAAFFSMAPAVLPKMESSPRFDCGDDDHRKAKQSTDCNLRTKSVNHRPKSILKKSPSYLSSMNASENSSSRQNLAKSKLRVSINLPDNEISLKRIGRLSFFESEREDSSSSSISRIRRKSIVEVLREVDADILALQDVKAQEEKGMRPLSDLADALGMNYVFAESWAPEYGNAILSKWPIKRWKIQKIFDDTDFRNVLKATVDVPQVGEVNFYCTLLDHLDETWRMKQMKAIIQSNDEPHILAGGLNSLDQTDYSPERWADIVKYYEEMGKPKPKSEVMSLLKSNQYTDAKNFAGECESVVVIAKGQSVQGTCKYGTRVDYILSSSESSYQFVPGSYSVFSSKGTSDHHIVKVEILKVDENAQQFVSKKEQQPKQKIIKATFPIPF